MCQNDFLCVEYEPFDSLTPMILACQYLCINNQIYFCWQPNLNLNIMKEPVVHSNTMLRKDINTVIVLIFHYKQQQYK